MKTLISTALLTHLCLMEFLVFINWTNPFTILGLLDGNFQLYSNFKSRLYSVSNSAEPDQMPLFAASDLVLHCLPMPHIKDARLEWVKAQCRSHSTLSVISKLTYDARLRHTNAQAMYRQNVREKAWSQNRIEQNRPERRTESDNHRTMLTIRT